MMYASFYIYMGVPLRGILRREFEGDLGVRVHEILNLMISIFFSIGFLPLPHTMPTCVSAFISGLSIPILSDTY